MSREAAVCPVCDASMVKRTERLQVGEDELEADVWKCETCGTGFVDPESEVKIALAMSTQPPTPADLEFFDSLTPEGKEQLRLINKLARSAFPDSQQYAKFFLTHRKLIGGVPGEMVNTEEGREHVKNYLALLLAMRDPVAAGTES